MVSIPLEVIPLQSEGYHILVQVEMFDKPFKMVVDTGASKTVLDRSTLIAAGVDESAFVQTDILSSGLGTNTMKSAFATIPELRIDTWSVAPFTSAVLDLSTINYAYQQMNLSPIVGVLGGDILHTYAAVINYRNATLRLNKRERKA